MSCNLPVNTRSVRSLSVGESIRWDGKSCTVEDIYPEYDGGNFRVVLRIPGNGRHCYRLHTLSLAGSNRVTVS